MGCVLVWFIMVWPQGLRLSKYNMIILLVYSSLMQTTHCQCFMDHNEGLETPPQADRLLVIVLQPCKVVLVWIIRVWPQGLLWSRFMV